MSFVTAVRDYSEHLTTISFNLADKQNLMGLVQATAAFVFQTLKYIACYITTFQWFRDVTYLPLRVPEISLSVLNERLYPLDNGSINLLTILEPAVVDNNKLLVGFVNSCFASLPLSCAHLLVLRRLLVEGVPAGVASGFGTVVGQCWLLTCVLCGLRGLVVPWLSLEPLNYIVGICLLVTVIYNMSHQRSIRLVEWEQRSKLLGIFLVNLALTLCEQTSLFAHLSNLSLGAEPSHLESFSSKTPLEGLAAHGSYMLSFFAGSLLFTGLFSGLLLLLKQVWLEQSNLTNSRIVRRLNRTFQVLILAFSFASIPYYGVDYLLFKGAGFLPEDRALRGTVVYPYTLKRPGTIIGHVSAGTSFDTDVVPFDRGWYGSFARRYPRSYEQLNYQGEMSWLRRFERLPNLQKRRINRNWRKWLRTRFRTAQSINFEKPLREERVRVKTMLSRASIIPFPGEESGYKKGREPKRWWMIDRLTERVPAFITKRNQERWSIFVLRRTLSSGISSPLYRRGRQKIRLLERRFKNKFYSNGIYRLLLRADIDNFLGRQPSDQLLSPTQEIKLFHDRWALFSYYNSFREYRKMDTYELFKGMTLGAKSYSDRPYNQQFKGTIKVVRKAFAVTHNPYRNPLRRRVIKYDQPLPYGGGNPLLHEEGGTLGSEQLSQQSWDQQPEQPDEEGGVIDNGQSSQQSWSQEPEQPYTSPFVEETDPKPLYAAWNELLRKMVVTNLSLERGNCLYQVVIDFPSMGMDSPDDIMHYSPDIVIDDIPDLVKDPDMVEDSDMSEDPVEDPDLVMESPDRVMMRDIHVPYPTCFKAWPIPKQCLYRTEDIREDGLEEMNMKKDGATDRRKVPYEMIVNSKNDPNPALGRDRINRFKRYMERYAIFKPWPMDTWPENIRGYHSTRRVFPPTWGGYTWPGSSNPFPYMEMKDIHRLLSGMSVNGIKRWFGSWVEVSE